MYFDWNADTIRWYLNAEKYAGFYKKIASIVSPALRGHSSLCDLGCGPAVFDFEIAPVMSSIDCVDLNETALASVAQRAARRGFRNIRTRLTNCDKLSGQWDVAFMSFFGSRDLDRYLPLCKKLIAVVAAASESDLFPRRERPTSRNTVDDTVKHLDGKGISYKLTPLRYEFGQPFVSVQDAEAFERTYAQEASDDEIRAFLARRLVETGDAAFPLYIPRMKTVGIFELDGGTV